MKKDIISVSKKSRNLGIEFLRFILCLWIVIIHCSTIKKEFNKFLSRGFHVPTFFMLSFYFYYPIAYQRKIAQITSKFVRLLFPYIFWPIIAFISDHILKKYNRLGIYKQDLSYKDIILQILTGSQYYKVFYFHFNLMFISLFLTIISFLFKKNSLNIFVILGIICLYLHFSGIYRKFIIAYKNNIRLSLGCLVEAFPSAIIGCIYNSMKILLKVNDFAFFLHLILLSLICLLFKYDIFISYKGIIYPNVFLNISSSTILILLFGSLNFDKITKIKDIINLITKYTGGIYYIHPLFSKHIFSFFKFKKTYYSFLIIYVISYCTCFFGSKIFIRNKFKYLFI